MARRNMTVAARDLRAGDRFRQYADAEVRRVHQNWGTVFVWFTDTLDTDRADVILAHGDPVGVSRPDAPEATQPVNLSQRDLQRIFQALALETERLEGLRARRRVDDFAETARHCADLRDYFARLLP